MYLIRMITQYLSHMRRCGRSDALTSTRSITIMIERKASSEW